MTDGVLTGEGLRFFHENGVIHLDLKPANIFITGEGWFKIGDFGWHQCGRDEPVMRARLNGKVISWHLRCCRDSTARLPTSLFR
jgi:serine/threonine protein kinase